MRTAVALPHPSLAAAAADGAWRDDLRYFLRCYAWGFAFFLAFLS